MDTSLVNSNQNLDNIEKDEFQTIDVSSPIHNNNNPDENNNNRSLENIPKSQKTSSGHLSETFNSHEYLKSHKTSTFNICLQQ